MATGNFQAASANASQLARIGVNGQGEELLWSLNAGNTSLYGGQPDRTIAALDGAEVLMRASEEASFNWGSTYRFGAYDAVMVNTYKALAMLSRGDREGARVEMNRLDERQSRVRDRFQREIADAREQAERRADANGRRALASAQTSPEVREQTQALERWATYAPFVNPAATYLHGLFFLTTGQPGDAERARNSFERVVGMTGANPMASEDMALARQVASGRPLAPHIWVILENGQSPVFEQMNFTVPMPVMARGGGVTVRPVTVSMPRFVAQPGAVRGLDVAAGPSRVTTRPIGSIEAVMASEFRQRYPGLLAATVFEAVAKAALVSGVNAAAGRGRDGGGLAGALLEAAALTAANVTTSDTRSWYSLPREFQGARLVSPRDGRVVLNGGGASETVTVPTDRSSIIYVKMQQPGSPLRAQVFPL